MKRMDVKAVTLESASLQEARETRWVDLFKEVADCEVRWRPWRIWELVGCIEQPPESKP